MIKNARKLSIYDDPGGDGVTIMSNIQAMYSLRQLNFSVTKCLKVFRNSDNTELDIGYKNGVLDTAALLAFVGTSPGSFGKVSVWYDQSGNGLDAFKSAASNRPDIVSAGAVITKNGKPTVSFDGGSGLITAQSFLFCSGAGEWQCSVVASANDTATRLVWSGDVNVTPVNRLAQFIRSAGTNWNSIGFNSVGAAGTATQAKTLSTQTILGAKRTTTNIQLYVNGGTAAATAIAGTPFVGNPNAAVGMFGVNSANNNWLIGTIQEIAHYNVQNESIRIAARDNQRAYYGTY